MGLLDKVKGILFDEEEIEIPEIKKEPKKTAKKNIEPIIEENPIKELKIPKDDFKDTEYRTESTFTFPIDFEDEEPEKIVEEEKPVIKERKEIHKEERPKDRDFTEFLNRREEHKKFKPTPIISPVYGVLDQNYKKEDVIVKKDVLRTPNDVSLDEVRKRAFGSLEDELEQNLTNTKEIKITEEVKVKKEKKIKKVDDSIDKLKTIGELIEEDEHDIEIPEIESINDGLEEYNNNDETTNTHKSPTSSVDGLIKDDKDEELEEKEDTIEDNDAEIDDDEADLFSLIDSMYEEKGE